MAAKPKAKAKRSKGGIKAAEARLWAEMQEEFETKGTGVRELARKYGIKSHASVVRRINDPDKPWKRDEASISAHLATEKVLESLDQKDKLAAAANSQAEPEANQPVTTKDQVKTEEISTGEPLLTAGSLALAEQKSTVRSATKLAIQQAAQLEREIEVADLTLETSTRMLKMLKTLMETEDMDKIADVMSRFNAIGGKMESFSSLIRAAVTGVEKAVTMRRKALGMDQVLKGTNPNTSPLIPQELPDQVRNIMPGLSTEQLIEMRKVSALLNRQLALQRPGMNTVIDGEKG